MSFDYTTLLLAIALSGACLVVTLLGSWMKDRSETFFLNWAAGSGICVLGVSCYIRYVTSGSNEALLIALALLVFGISLLYGSAYQFRLRRPAAAPVAVATALGWIAVLTPTMLGFDGIGLIAFNITTATLLALSAREYWLARVELPLPLSWLAAIYALNALGFLLCAAMLALQGQASLGAAPANWAETLSLLLVGWGVVVGAFLSLQLNRERAHGIRRPEALFDPETGFHSRGVLFDRFRHKPLDTQTAIVVFEIDPSRQAGRPAGGNDDITAARQFSDRLRPLLRHSDTVARTGPRRFAAVLRHAQSGRLDDLLATVSRSDMPGQQGRHVHAGHAFASPLACDFDSVLDAAESALAFSKRKARL